MSNGFYMRQSHECKQIEFARRAGPRIFTVPGVVYSRVRDRAGQEIETKAQRKQAMRRRDSSHCLIHSREKSADDSQR